MIHQDRLLSGRAFSDLLGDADSALVSLRAPEGRMGSHAEQAITGVLHAVETGDAQGAALWHLSPTRTSEVSLNH